MKGKSSRLNLRVKIKENSMKRKLYMSKMEVGIVLNNKWSEQAKCVTVRIIKKEKRKSENFKTKTTCTTAATVDEQVS